MSELTDIDMGAISFVLASYRSKSSHITGEQITAAWGQFDRVRALLHAEQMNDSGPLPTRAQVTALSRALDAFIEAYGHGITWAEVLPIIAEASGLVRAYEKCEQCNGDGDLFNGGWKRPRCDACGGSGNGAFGGYVSVGSHPHTQDAPRAAKTAEGHGPKEKGLQ